MLSILIPTYNYNVYPLAFQLEQQALDANIVFEIICFDDGSTNAKTIKENEKINTLENSSFIALDVNIGRSKIRNSLASKANFEWLLFLDADTMPVSNLFISNYLSALHKQSKIIYGGILYKQKTPPNNQVLRWIYGKNREALSKTLRNKNPYLRFLTLSFLIHKNVFKKVAFNEDIPNLRHEDTLFALDLKREMINIAHIDNPVYHLGLETNKQFLQKSLQSVKAISIFVNQGLMPYNATLITKIHHYTNKIHLNHVLKHLYLNKKIREYFESQLLSREPSLFLFDLYRLSYFCSLKKQE
ncbi:glycosyltransferase family 2 protein [Thalassobellus suaedae]|uniref:Glycosyltransferase family 2 protein n=1 Tax=Thalassobellus suaedae TaxID=3074124 RepID=A0ABY9Y5E6_9FLAO|nr:glycosyltransferase family 2 protein [Flavobacteriaceae bacterium HL-DH10]